MSKRKMSDLAMILLLAASRRKRETIHPLLAAAGKDVAAIDAAISDLLHHKLVAQSDAADIRQTWREEHGQRTALVLTDKGRAAVAAELAKGREEVAQSSKIGSVLTLLRAPGGATLDELVAATGWQPHTTRAALTGLRKKGHAIVRERAEGVSRYSIKEAQQ